jgi:hypothetical protein
MFLIAYSGKPITILSTGQSPFFGRKFDSLWAYQVYTRYAFLFTSVPVFEGEPHVIDKLVAQGESFSFETTLAGRSYARMIPQWQAQGYAVHLLFLTLPDAKQP